MDYVASWNVEEQSAALFAFNKGNLSLLSGFSLNTSTITKFDREYWENILDDIDIILRRKEKEFSAFARRLYFVLPHFMAKIKFWEEIYPLKKGKADKEITVKDISLAKRSLEAVALDWDDRLAHHFIIGYEVDNQKYNRLTTGIRGKKLKIKSMLISLKIDFYDAINEMVENRGRKLAGIVYSPLCDLCGVLNKKEIEDNTAAVVNIRDKDTVLTVYVKGLFHSLEKYPFGVGKLAAVLEDKFAISEEMAFDILRKHFTFNADAYEKEITLRREGSYIKISAPAVNATIENLYAKEIAAIHEKVTSLTSCSEPLFIFAGRGVSFTGFSDFIKGRFAFKLKNPGLKLYFSNYGCVKYGLSLFLEKENIGKGGFFARIRDIHKIYKDYF